jgi:D-serine dehydratase
MNIDSIKATVIDDRTKGIPGGTKPFALSEIGSKGWNLLREDLPLPLMVLKRSSLDHNASVFGAYLTSHHLSLAPHGKTTMAPQIFAEQLANGAWGITAATANQVQVMRAYGVSRIILANQLVGKANVLAIAQEINADPAFDFLCFIDSAAQLDNMARQLDGVTLGHPIRLLIEVGVVGARTGVRNVAEALALSNAIAAADSSKFRFAGIATFEGVAPGLDRSVEPVADLADTLLEIARSLPKAHYAGLDEFILSGGGSSYFDIIADRFSTLALDIPVRVLLRSGCYVTNDSGSYKNAQDAAKADPHRSWKSELKPALEAWAYVQSRPEENLAFLTMGKRDIPFDSGLPKPFKLYRPGVGFLDVGQCEVFATNDQHAYVRLGPDTDWRVGDLVASGISHPCTAFDKWRLIPVVDDEYNVIDGVMTFF